MEGRSQLFLAENRLNILQVNSGIVTTSLFKVHIPAMSKCVRLCTELSGMEADNEVKLREKFRPLRLVVLEKLGRGEIFEIFVVGNNVNGSHGTFEVVVPNVEHFVNSEELLVVDIIV